LFFDIENSGYTLNTQIMLTATRKASKRGRPRRGAWVQTTIRPTPQQYAVIKAAAKAKSMSLTDFVVVAAVAHAGRA
jgi:hypothetical protein